eukprot:GILJ01002122.1.p1 GENE.GILJ01002122.1~~GILJ01002122.1.p1  ORF type:complete len:409 (-),score=87.80 GILJ01002122.1:142-1320(-)
MTTFVQLSDEEPALDLINLLAHQQEEAKAAAFEKQSISQLQARQYGEVVETLLQCGELLFKGADKEVEGVFIIIGSLLQQVESAEQVVALTNKIADVITQNKTQQTALRLRLLSNVFNIFDRKSSALFDLFLKTVDFAAQTQNAQLLVPHLKNIDNFVVDWNLSVDQQKTLFLSLSQVLRGVGHRDAYKLLVRYLSKFEGSSGSDLTVAKEHAKQAVTEAIKGADFTQCDVLLEMAAVKQLETDSQYATLFRLLKIFAVDTLDAFNAFHKQNPTFLQSVGLNVDDCVEKMRLLSLCSLAADQTELSYASIASGLQIAEEDVEQWIVRAVTVGIVEAKMDQLKRTVSFNRCTQRVFGDAQWKQVSSQIKSWKENVRALLEVVKNNRTAPVADV